ELYRGEPPETPLPAHAVVGAFDPVDDRQAELLPRAPTVAVQDVLLEHGEERLHRDVVRAGAGPTHRTDEPTVPDHANELPGPELRTPVRVDDRAGGAPEPDRVPQGCDREGRLHPSIDRVAD